MILENATEPEQIDLSFMCEAILSRKGPAQKKKFFKKPNVAADVSPWSDEAVTTDLRRQLLKFRSDCVSFETASPTPWQTIGL